MIALLKQIPSEAQIRTYLRRSIFGKNMFCPVCHSRHVNRAAQKRYWCMKCRRRFSLLSHTWLKDMKLNLRTFLALHELLLGFFPNLPSIKPKPASLFISLLNLTVDSKPMVVVFTVVLMPFGLLPIKKIFIVAGSLNLLQKLKACLVICVLLSAECIIIALLVHYQNM